MAARIGPAAIGVASPCWRIRPTRTPCIAHRARSTTSRSQPMAATPGLMPPTGWARLQYLAWLWIRTTATCCMQAAVGRPCSNQLMVPRPGLPSQSTQTSLHCWSIRTTATSSMPAPTVAECTRAPTAAGHLRAWVRPRWAASWRSPRAVRPFMQGLRPRAYPKASMAAEPGETRVSRLALATCSASTARDRSTPAPTSTAHSCARSAIPIGAGSDGTN